MLIRLGHSPDPDDVVMFWALATKEIDTRGFEFEHVLSDIATLNDWARVAERFPNRRTAMLHGRMTPADKEATMQRFKQVMTIESNWSDSPQEEIIDENNRRYSALAMLLRARYLVDVDCWTEVRGQPIKPGTMCRVVREKLQPVKIKAATS